MADICDVLHTCAHLFGFGVVLVGAPDVQHVGVASLLVFGAAPARLAARVDAQLALEHCQEVIRLLAVHHAHLSIRGIDVIT